MKNQTGAAATARIAAMIATILRTRRQGKGARLVVPNRPCRRSMSHRSLPAKKNSPPRTIPIGEARARPLGRGDPDAERADGRSCRVSIGKPLRRSRPAPLESVRARDESDPLADRRAARGDRDRPHSRRPRESEDERPCAETEAIAGAGTQRARSGRRGRAALSGRRGASKIRGAADRGARGVRDSSRRAARGELERRSSSTAARSRRSQAPRGRSRSSRRRSRRRPTRRAARRSTTCARKKTTS